MAESEDTDTEELSTENIQSRRKKHGPKAFRE